MPIHDLGYRPWKGVLESPYIRWWVIAQTGIRLAWRSMWLRRTLLAAWAPALFIGLGFFAFERYAKEQPLGLMQRGPAAFQNTPFRQLPNADVVIQAMESGDLPRARHTAWAWLLLTFFRYPQGTLLVILVGLIAPPLVSQDLRTRAYLIYFARPITRWTYVLGKSAVVYGYVAMITTVPAICLYVLGVLLSPDLSVLWNTWDLPLRIIIASLVLMIPTTAMALCFSSLTRESRYASFAWFSVWILGWVAYGNLSAIDMGAQGLHSLGVVQSRWTLLSMYHTLGSVQSWVFGVGSDSSDVLSAFLLLGCITVVSYAILLHRVTAPMRI